MRLRRWFYAIASVFAVALVMFPLNFFVGGAVAAACGGKFPAVRPARTALCMDAQGAAHRQAQRIPWDCRVCAIPQMCRSRHPCRICRAY